MRTCVICGKEFAAKGARKTCSDKCRIEQNRKTQRERDERERALNRESVILKCECGCGAIITGRKRRFLDETHRPNYNHIYKERKLMAKRDREKKMDLTLYDTIKKVASPVAVVTQIDKKKRIIVAKLQLPKTATLAELKKARIEIGIDDYISGASGWVRMDLPRVKVYYQ